MVLGQPGIYPNIFKRHIQRKKIFYVFICPVPSHKWVEVFAGFSAEMALRGNCRGEVVMRELSGSERTAHTETQGHQTADVGKTGVPTVWCDSDQEEIGVALCLRRRGKLCSIRWRVGLWQRNSRCELKGRNMT